jgi:predicted alpha/beta-fold hydrolase
MKRHGPAPSRHGAPQSTESPLSNHPPFQPAWWLPGPHLQTMWGKLVRRIQPAHQRIERWPTPDGDSLSVARVDPPAPDAPVLAILHGLEGSIRSTYAQGLMHQARQRGWGAAMLIWRTCDGRTPDAPRLYHSGETGDADFFFRRLAAESPGRPILAVGVSLGANVLLKWLGDRAGTLPPELRAAAAVSTPFDLAAGSRHLERGFSRRYVRFFVRSLRRKAVAALERHPSLPIDLAALDRARTFFEFDDAVTAPVHGFRDAADYYARSSSLPVLARVAIPTLLLSAIDDPFLPAVVLEEVRRSAATNPRLVLDFTARGGHVGWVAGPPWAPRYHMEVRVTDWLGTR